MIPAPETYHGRGHDYLNYDLYQSNYDRRARRPSMQGWNQYCSQSSSNYQQSESQIHLEEEHNTEEEFGYNQYMHWYNQLNNSQQHEKQPQHAELQDQQNLPSRPSETLQKDAQAIPTINEPEPTAETEDVLANSTGWSKLSAGLLTVSNMSGGLTLEKSKLT